MPELPEVETVRLQLLRRIVGKVVREVEVYHGKTVRHDMSLVDELPGKEIGGIDRVGKLLIFSFTDAPDVFVLAHLKMTGQFFYFADGEQMVGGGHSLNDRTLLEGEWPHKHTRVALLFTDGSRLYFNDMRLFGYFALVNAKEKEYAVARFGDEPQRKGFDIDTFRRRLKKRQTPIKAALLDQSLIAGLGNIYVDEVLFAVGVDPRRPAARVRDEEVDAIARAAGRILAAAIKAGGTTFRSFKDAEGKRGNYKDQLEVFGADGTPCPRCGTEIIKIRVAGRGTHLCPQCQS